MLVLEKLTNHPFITDQSAAKAKRERKKSTSDHHKHKSAHDAPSQKHEAPLSIASQMFMQDEEDSGNDSAAPLPETVKAEVSFLVFTVGNKVLRGNLVCMSFRSDQRAFWTRHRVRLQ